jgi:hypothetical protein
MSLPVHLLTCMQADSTKPAELHCFSCFGRIQDSCPRLFESIESSSLWAGNLQ